jgi:hypothetical protein
MEFGEGGKEEGKVSCWGYGGGGAKRTMLTICRYSGTYLRD